MALETPIMSSQKAATLAAIDASLTAIFASEAVLKLCAFGLM
jgi:hypothetical protein